MAPPFRQAEFDIIYGEGISHQGNLLDLGLERGMIQKSGSYFSFGEERLGQGRSAARAFLREHTDIAETLEAMIRKDAAPAPAAVAEPEEIQEEGEEVLAGRSA
jgi:recombination protein RecA